jgi:hypothetical protein
VDYLSHNRAAWNKRVDEHNRWTAPVSGEDIEQDLTHLEEATLRRLYVDTGLPIEFGHTLHDQIGGQLDAGLVLTGMYEDHFDEATGDLLSRYMDSFVATRAIKLAMAGAGISGLVN